MNEAIRPGPETAQASADLPVLAVVVPTFNERDNVPKLYRKLEAALAGIAWEVIFVDDNSPDGSAAAARALGEADARVRCIRRIGERRDQAIERRSKAETGRWHRVPGSVPH